MDTLTHALSGALMARATAPAVPKPGAIPLARRIGLGFVATAFPDIDFVAGYISPLAYLHQHRGITHSLIMLPLWALLLAWLCTLVWRGREGWRAYFGVIASGIALHIAGDWITSFGTMIFAPLSDARYALSTTFIIDLFFSGIILAGLAASVVWARSRLPARLGLAALAGYVVLQFALQQQAVDFGREYARREGVRAVRVSAEPRPVSPFNWMVIVADEERYHYSLVNLVRRAPPAPPGPDSGLLARLGAPYLPLDQAIWVQAERWGHGAQRGPAKEAFDQPGFAFFRWFAAYPAFLRADLKGAQECAWFHDLRFFTPGRDSWPFRFGMCRLAGGSWRPYQLVGEKPLPL